MENAVANGYLMARVEGYAAKRARLRQGSRPAARKPPEDWVAGLMALSGQARQPAPADSPVAGLTTESFRAQVAEMREAEYQLARTRKSGPH